MCGGVTTNFVEFVGFLGGSAGRVCFKNGLIWGSAGWVWRSVMGGIVDFGGVVEENCVIR